MFSDAETAGPGTIFRANACNASFLPSFRGRARLVPHRRDARAPAATRASPGANAAAFSASAARAAVAPGAAAEARRAAASRPPSSGRRWLRLRDAHSLLRVPALERARADVHQALELDPARVRLGLRAVERVLVLHEAQGVLARALGVLKVAALEAARAARAQRARGGEHLLRAELPRLSAHVRVARVRQRRVAALAGPAAARVEPGAGELSGAGAPPRSAAGGAAAGGRGAGGEPAGDGGVYAELPGLRFDEPVADARGREAHALGRRAVHGGGTRLRRRDRSIDRAGAEMAARRREPAALSRHAYRRSARPACRPPPPPRRPRPKAKVRGRWRGRRRRPCAAPACCPRGRPRRRRATRPRRTKSPALSSLFSRTPPTVLVLPVARSQRRAVKTLFCMLCAGCAWTAPPSACGPPPPCECAGCANPPPQREVGHRLRRLRVRRRGVPRGVVRARVRGAARRVRGRGNHGTDGPGRGGVPRGHGFGRRGTRTRWTGRSEKASGCFPSSRARGAFSLPRSRREAHLRVRALRMRAAASVRAVVHDAPASNPDSPERRPATPVDAGRRTRECAIRRKALPRKSAGDFSARPNRGEKRARADVCFLYSM